MIVFIRVSVTLFVLPGLVKVFSSVSHSTRGSQPLTKRSRGHIHKLLLLHPRTHKKDVHYSLQLELSKQQQMDCFSFLNGS